MLRPQTKSKLSNLKLYFGKNENRLDWKSALCCLVTHSCPRNSHLLKELFCCFSSWGDFFFFFFLIIKALFCPKETNRRIYFFWSTCLWILSAVITGIYVLPQMHYHWTLRAAIGSRYGNHLGNKPENKRSERLSSLLKVTQTGYKTRWYKNKKFPFEVCEIWVLIYALLINI